MYDDELDEEMLIAGEQDSSGTTLSAETFKRPISEISAPKIVTVTVDMTMKEAIALMQEKKIGSLVIVKDKKIAGIMTERDVLMKVIGVIKDWEKTPIKEIMTAAPQTLMKGDEIAYILNNMHIGGYRHIPLVNENDEPISMISIKDIVSWVLDFFPNEISNLTGEPYRGTISREGA